MRISAGHGERATNSVNLKIPSIPIILALCVPLDLAPLSHTKPNHSDCVTAWCGMTRGFLVGPYFFQTPTSSGPKRCSVIRTNCRAMLREQLISALQERDCLETKVFMQDGAPSHLTKPVKKLLHDTFGAD